MAGDKDHTDSGEYPILCRCEKSLCAGKLQGPERLSAKGEGWASLDLPSISDTLPVEERVELNSLDNAVESPETMTSSGWKRSEPREHFIPIRAAQLLRLMLRQRSLNREQIEQFQNTADLISGLYNQAYFHRLEDMLEDYSSFDPDKDLIFNSREGRTLLALRGERFAQHLGEILGKGNYVRVEPEKLKQALETSAQWGIRYTVDFSQFDFLEIYVRGIEKKTIARRTWRNFWHKETRLIDFFRRIVIVFRPKLGHRFGRKLDTNSIYMKVFKDIPETEVDMMVPGSKAVFSWADQGKIYLPAIGGIFSGIKIAKSLIIWGPRLFLLLRFVALTSLIKWIGGTSWFTDYIVNENGDGLNFTGWTIAGFLAAGFYGFRYFMSYSRTAKDHQNHLVNNLYFRNLGNNSSVLFRILEDAKEQELRETLLAYFLLWHKAPPSGWTIRELDQHAEEFLQMHLKRKIDFEVTDALRKLVHWNLAYQNETRRWVAVDPVPAGRALRTQINHGVHGSSAPPPSAANPSPES